MLEEMVKSIVHKTLGRNYPHLRLPSVVYARVDSVTMLGETFDYKELIIHNDETGTSYRGHITANWYEYKLAVLDRFGSPDTAFPPLPGIKSKKQFEAGAIVAIALLYGELTPAIIGEAKL